MVMTSFQVNSANRELQMKTRDDWGTSYSTESDRVNIHTGDLCEEAKPVGSVQFMRRGIVFTVPRNSVVARRRPGRAAELNAPGRGHFRIPRA